ncbi:MAG: glycosyltransferase family 4 protein [Thermoleophilia bacterium]
MTSSALMGKGTECLLEAAGLLAARGVAGLQVRIAGVPPSSELEGLYRRVARRCGVDAHVEWLGRLDADEIVGELEAADLFVYPTRVDNSPNAVVEAMLAGVPIVASRVGGMPTLVEHEKNGLLVEPGDPAALAAAIQWLLANRKEAARLGAVGREAAQTRNNPDAIVARMMGIYEEIIAAEAMA